MQKLIDILSGLETGDHRSLARAISIVENEMKGSDEILQRTSQNKPALVIGITGPPGAGKSTLINALAAHVAQKHRVAILAVDPTSPFSHGSLLGDRLRMAEHFNNPNIFIRSVATRGSLGGLSAKAMEITDVIKFAGFDYVFIETVGVGQSEVEIASLADTTVVVFVPESGDEIQTIKSGIMEIADIFVVNKSDRDGADVFIKSIKQVLHNRLVEGWEIPVLKTVSTMGKGVNELFEKIVSHHKTLKKGSQLQLLLQKAVHLILAQKMRSINKKELEEKLKQQSQQPGFNLYNFIKKNYQ